MIFKVIKKKSSIYVCMFYNFFDLNKLFFVFLIYSLSRYSYKLCQQNNIKAVLQNTKEVLF